MMKFIKHSKPKVIASSIMEVVVALIICMTIFSISASIILKSQRSNNVKLKQKASIALSNINRNNLDEYMDFNSPGLELSVITDKNDSIPDLCKVTVSAYDSEGKVLGEKILWVNNRGVN